MPMTTRIQDHKSSFHAAQKTSETGLDRLGFETSFKLGAPLWTRTLLNKNEPIGSKLTHDKEALYFTDAHPVTVRRPWADGPVVRRDGKRQYRRAPSSIETACLALIFCDLHSIDSV